VLAPADGVIAYARNDVPDQLDPATNDDKVYSGLPEPNWAAGGNVVAIDHGNGEFSVLCHMQRGSVRVKKGDRVKRGDILGNLGASGNVNGPHVHMQLQSDLPFNECDSLPFKFKNVDGSFRRGAYLTPQG
jgi:murein DD-endopeptidase MepM/ murein hydrolase activator NlpD